MTLPSGSVQTRRIAYSQQVVAPPNVYEDAMYGTALDPVLRTNPYQYVQDYRFIGTAQSALAIPTGTPSYWWGADYGVATVDGTLNDNEPVATWTGRGSVANQVLRRNLTGVFGPVVGVDALFRQDPLTNFPYIQPSMPTGLSAYNCALTLDTGDTAQNFTVHMAVRLDLLPVYNLVADLRVDAVSYPATVFSSNNLLYVGMRNAAEFIYTVFPLVTGTRWGIVSLMYNQTARKPIVFLNGVQQTVYSGTATTFTASGVFPLRDLYIRGSAYRYATVTELILDKQAQTTGVALAWQNYLLSKYYY